MIGTASPQTWGTIFVCLAGWWFVGFGFGLFCFSDTGTLTDWEPIKLSQNTPGILLFLPTQHWNSKYVLRIRLSLHT